MIRFYFDFISPYAYLGHRRVYDVAARHGREVELVPILFAALLDAWGHKGPAEIPPKRVYTFKQVLRFAHEQGAPLRPPPAHPFNPLLALRLATLELPPDDRRRLVTLLFDRTWATGEGVTDADALAEALDGVGLAGADLVERAQAPANKAVLREATEAACRAGIFGVPTFVVDDEAFWGQDSLPHLDRFLAGEDPVDETLLAAWESLPAQARRPASS